MPKLHMKLLKKHEKSAMVQPSRTSKKSTGPVQPEPHTRHRHRQGASAA